MWNHNRSLMLSRIAVGVFSALLVALVFGALPLTQFLLRVIDAPIARGQQALAVTLFLLTEYASALPAGLLLFELNGLLQRIGNGAVFEPRNETALRRISWYCIIEAVICVASALYYLPFLLVAVAAGFMALIVRVIKNVFAEAIVLKTEQEFTI